MMPVTNQIFLKELMSQFAYFFTQKDLVGISTILAEDFSLYDPELKWIRGKKRVLEVLEKQFSETKNVSYEIVNAYVDGNVGVLEFKIAMDDLNLSGVDIIEFANEKMTELRCYYNSPDKF